MENTTFKHEISKGISREWDAVIEQTLKDHPEYTRQMLSEMSGDCLPLK